MAFLLTSDNRERMARATAALLAMPALTAAIEEEVSAVFRDHPMLPATDQARRILCGMVMPEFSKLGGETPAQKNAA